MKLLHIADLHIGKRINEFNMLEDQKYILEQILGITVEEKPEGILIAGDVYDKSQPTVEAVELLDWFLTALTALGQPVFMISGNHDSPRRLSFGSRLLAKNGLHIAGVFDGVLQKVELQDEYGAVNIYLLPFLKPAMVRPFFEKSRDLPEDLPGDLPGDLPEAPPINSYDEALRAVVATAAIDEGERNILLAHQFVVNGSQQPQQSDSETLSVGGLDHVDASAFDPFDYVALGHLHRPQSIGRPGIRYAGSPLKYSFSEARHQKSVTILELGPKGQLTVNQRPLVPLRDLREIKGPIAELLRIGREEGAAAADYIHITLTDEAEIYDAIGRLREVYTNLMILDFENSRRGQAAFLAGGSAAERLAQSPMDLFAAFYCLQNNNQLTAEQVQVMERIFEEAGGEA